MSDIVRKAVPAEMERLFLMGRDAWGKGMSVQEYFDSCRKSPKYLKGEWHVLDHARFGAVASLVVYRLATNVAGLGTIATLPEYRKQGFGARLIRAVLDELERSGVNVVFLFSDIAPRYYERFGFKALPEEFQKHPGSVCMLRNSNIDAYLKSAEFRLPGYF